MLDLPIFECNGRWSAKNIDDYGHTADRLVDVVYRSLVMFKCSIGNYDSIALLKFSSTIRCWTIAAGHLTPLQRFDLPMFQLNRRGPAENVDNDTHAAAGFVDRVDFPFEVFKRAFIDLDAISLFHANV